MTGTWGALKTGVICADHLDKLRCRCGCDGLCLYGTHEVCLSSAVGAAGVCLGVSSRNACSFRAESAA